MNDIILLSLLLQGPRHGYQLKQEAALVTASQPLHNNTVYPILARFVEAGWTVQRENQESRGRNRQLYEITLAGHHALIEKLSVFTEADAAHGPAFRLRVGLFDLLDPTTRRRILILRDNHLARRFERIRSIGAAYRPEGWAGEALTYTTGEIEREREWIATLSTLVDQSKTQSNQSAA